MVADGVDEVSVRRLTDEQRDKIEPLPPSTEAQQKHQFRRNRKVAKRVINRCCVGLPWRNPRPEEFDPWQRSVEVSRPLLRGRHV